MNRLARVIILALVVGAVPSTSAAQAKAGDKEILVSGFVGTFFTSFENPFTGDDDSLTVTSGNVIFGFGYFATDRLQIGVAPTLTISSSPDLLGGTNIDTDLGASGRLQYYFGAGDATVKPYIGYELLIRSFDAPEGASVADNLFNSALFGVKNYLSERTALDFSGSYGFGMKDPGSLQQLTFRVGITYLF